jgi:hypothetical protein
MRSFAVCCGLFAALFVFNVSIGIAQRNAVSSQGGLGAISGVVTNARSRNPISGAVVIVSGGSAAKHSVLTDGAGRFVFPNLPAGTTYVVNVTKFGFEDAGLGSSTLMGTAAKLQLQDGQWINNIDVRLNEFASISGRVVFGRSDVAVGTLVEALRKVYVGGVAHFVSSAITKTDDLGSFELSNLKEGEYAVFFPAVQHVLPGARRPSSKLSDDASKEAISIGRQVVDLGLQPLPVLANNRLLIVPPTYFPAARNSTEAALISTGYGDHIELGDISLSRVRGFQVTGRLVPATSSKGLIVRLLVRGDEDLGTGHEQGVTKPDENGEFTLVNVPSGDYKLEVAGTIAQFITSDAATVPSPFSTRNMYPSRAGARSVSTAPPGVWLAQEGASGPYAQADVSLRDADLTTGDIPLLEPLSISGVIDGGSGSIRVTADPASANPNCTMQTSPETSSGTFEIRGLRPCQYFLRATTEGAVVEAITVDGTDYSLRPFNLSKSLTDVEVKLTSRPNTLTGIVHVRGESGTVGGTVVIFPTQTELWRMFGLSPPWMRSASYLGNLPFEIKNIPRGDYFVATVNVSSTRVWTQETVLSELSNRATRVSFAWGETKTVELSGEGVR